MSTEVLRITYGQDIISENVTDACKICFDKNIQIAICPRSGSKCALGSVRFEFGTVFICTNRKDVIKNKTILHSEAIAFSRLTPIFRNRLEEEKIQYEKNFRRLIHNLSTLNGHNIQELFSLASQDELSSNIKEQIGIIKRTISNNLQNSALAFLQIAKNNSAIKTEIDVFQKLYRSDAKLNRSNHSLHSVLLNILHVFFSDFTNKQVYVNVGECFDKVYIDYPSVRVAIFHIIHNAEKYCAPGHPIEISFLKKINIITMTIDMVSLKVELSEIDNIFKEGYSGIHATKNSFNGDGLGMYIANMMISKNEGSMEFLSNVGKTFSVMNDGKIYERNRISISLPKEIHGG